MLRVLGLFLLSFGVAVGVVLIWLQRDPTRHPSGDADAILAPADGKILLVQREIAPAWIDGQAWRIAIYLSLLDVHVQRAPAAGRVGLSERRGVGYQPAYKPQSASNVGHALGLESPLGRVLVIRSAGIIARRVTISVQVGDRLAAGERIGRILLGSRTEVYLPDTVSVCVRPGDKVRAGETILARWAA